METKVKHDEYFCNCSKASCPQSKYAITKFRNFFITNNTVQNVSLSRYFYIDRYFKNLKQNNKGIPPPYIYLCLHGESSIQFFYYSQYFPRSYMQATVLLF